MSNNKPLAYIHVPRTGGMSVASQLRGIRLRDGDGGQVKYLGHKPNNEHIQNKYQTISCVRHPYDRFMSMYRKHLNSYIDDSKWKIQHYINMVSRNEWQGYQNYWFKYHTPDILLRYTHLSEDWSRLVELYELNLSQDIPHLHDTTHVEYILPTPEQQRTIFSILELDIAYYNKLMLIAENRNSYDLPLKIGM